MRSVRRKTSPQHGHTPRMRRKSWSIATSGNFMAEPRSNIPATPPFRPRWPRGCGAVVEPGRPRRAPPGGAGESPGQPGRRQTSGPSLDRIFLPLHLSALDGRADVALSWSQGARARFHVDEGDRLHLAVQREPVEDDIVDRIEER